MNTIYKKLEEFDTPELCMYQAISDEIYLSVEFTTYDHKWERPDFLIQQKLSEICELTLVGHSNVGEYPEVQHTFNYQIDSIFKIPIETLDKINSTPVPEGATLVSKGSYSIPGIIEEAPILKSDYRSIWEDIGKMNAEEVKALHTKTNSNCPDCKDGFYYPLFGPPETCQTCAGSITCPGPCPDCNDTNYHLSHPQGTPGPCPTCNDSVNQNRIKLIDQSLHTIWKNVDWNKYPDIYKVEGFNPGSDYVIQESMFIPDHTMNQVILDRLEARITKHHKQSKARFLAMKEPRFDIELRLMAN